MRILCEDQNSDKWHEVKRGRISASNAKLCLAGRKTKGRRLYVEKIADDLEGIPDFDDHDVKPWFTDGIYYESFARGWYSFKYDTDVQQTGFVVHDDYDWIGCSPDGMVGDDGLIEIKYRKSLKTFGEHGQVKFTTADVAQMQMQMFVMDRKWCDYVNYWRSDDHDLERGHTQRVYRDQAYIDNTLIPAVIEFWQDVQEEIKQRKLQRESAF